MNFYSVRDLRTESKNMWENLSNGNEIVITNNGKPATIVSAAISGRFKICYDYRLLEEYTAVLHRPKFGFKKLAD